MHTANSIGMFMFPQTLSCASLVASRYPPETIIFDYAKKTGGAKRSQNAKK